MPEKVPTGITLRELFRHPVQVALAGASYELRTPWTTSSPFPQQPHKVRITSISISQLTKPGPRKGHPAIGGLSGVQTWVYLTHRLAFNHTQPSPPHSKAGGSGTSYAFHAEVPDECPLAPLPVAFP